MATDAKVKDEVAARLERRRAAAERAAAARVRVAEIRERREVEAEVEAERRAAEEAAERARRDEARRVRIARQEAVGAFFGGIGFEAVNGLGAWLAVPGTMHKEDELAPGDMRSASGEVSVDRESGEWRCSACGAHGDAFQAAVDRGLSREEAVSLLSECGLGDLADRAAGRRKGKS